MTLSSDLAGALWLLALVAPAVTLVLRLTRVDERALWAIRLASFNDALLLLGAAPWLVFAALHTAHAVHVAGSAPPAVVVVAATVVAGLVAGSGLNRRHAVEAHGPELQIVSLNVERDTPQAGAIATRLLELDPDVLLVQEYTSETAAAFTAAGVPAAFPTAEESAEQGWFGSALFSRHPVVAATLLSVGERPMVRTVLDVEGRHVTVVNIHLQAPIHRHDVTPWRTSFADLGAMVDETDGPVLLIGDWNATLCHGPMRRLLRDHQLVDAHSATGRWWPRTWPSGRRLPPLLCLDHALVDRSVQVVGTNELLIAGTDHKALLCALRLP